MESYSVQAVLKASGADKFARQFQNASKNIQGVEKNSDKASLSISKMIGVAAGIAGTIGLFRTLRDSVGLAFDRIDTMEQFDRVMTEMTGSTEAAEKALDDTNEAVLGTAYGLDVAAKGVQDFVTRGLDVDKATDRIAAWGDAVAFYGDGSNEQLSQVSDALAKMSTKGTVEMDQLNRLFDVGIDAVGMYAKATDSSSSDVQDALSAGEISAEDFIDTVTTAMMEGTNGVTQIEGAAKDAGASWSGSFANMRAATARGITNVIESIDEMLTSNGLPDMREMVSNFGSFMEETMTNAAESIGPFVENVKEIYNNLKPWIPLMVSVATGILTVVSAIKIFHQTKMMIEAIKLAVMALNTTIWANPWTYVAMAAVAAILLIIHYWEPISEFFVNLWEKVKLAFQLAYAYLDNITDGKFSEIINIIKGYMEMVWNNIKAVWEYIKNSFKNATDFLKALVKGDFKGMKDAMKNQMENAKQLLSNIWDNIKTFFNNYLSDIWSSVKQKFSDIVSSIGEKMNEALDKVKEIGGNILEFFGGIDLYESGRAIIQSAIDGLMSMKDNIMSKVDEIVGAVRDFWPFSPAKTGPLSDIHRMDFAGPIGQSIDKAKRPIERAMDGMIPSLDVPSPNIAGMVSDINRQTRAQLNNNVSAELSVNKQPIEINIYDNKEAVRAYVNENNAIDARFRRF